MLLSQGSDGSYRRGRRRPFWSRLRHFFFQWLWWSEAANIMEIDDQVLAAAVHRALDSWPRGPAAAACCQGIYPSRAHSLLLLLGCIQAQEMWIPIDSIPSGCTPARKFQQYIPSWSLIFLFQLCFLTIPQEYIGQFKGVSHKHMTARELLNVSSLTACVKQAIFKPLEIEVYQSNSWYKKSKLFGIMSSVRMLYIKFSTDFSSINSFIWAPWLSAVECKKTINMAVFIYSWQTINCSCMLAFCGFVQFWLLWDPRSRDVGSLLDWIDRKSCAKGL